MEFIDRQEELKALENFWTQKSAQLVVVYGKRRVGKTELIKHFMQDKASLYFLARKVREKENLHSLGNIFGEFFNDSFLKSRGFEKWDEVFVYLKNKNHGRFVLAIDEFPYLSEANNGISSIFQAGWDEYLKDTPIYMILCGSSISMMEQEVLAYEAPLYGRRTGQLFIKPFPFLKAREFFPGRDFVDVLKAFSVAGGMPAYISKLVGYSSLEKAVEEEIFCREKFLYEEVEFILKEELRELRNYFSVLKAIATNCTKVSEIINATGLEKSALHNYLFVLEDLHLIEKQVPVTEKNPQISRKGRYYLKDQFFKFWFNYCFPFMGELELGNKLASITAYDNYFDKVVTQNYEIVAQEILRQHQERMFTFHKVGRWWDKNDEIDIVALNETTNEIMFGEVKWSNKKVGTDVFEELKGKSKRLEWGGNQRKEYFCLFSRNGFTPQMVNLAKTESVFLFEKDKEVS